MSNIASAAGAPSTAFSAGLNTSLKHLSAHLANLQDV